MGEFIIGVDNDGAATNMFYGSDPKKLTNFFEHLASTPIPCTNAKCKRPRSEFPMAFRQDPYCSDDCRKALGLDLPK